MVKISSETLNDFLAFLEGIEGKRSENLYEFLSKLVEAAKNTRFGEPDDQDALYGPLNNANQLKNVKAFIDNLPAHAKVETGGKQADRPGFYFEPTVISGPIRAIKISQVPAHGTCEQISAIKTTP